MTMPSADQEFMALRAKHPLTLGYLDTYINSTAERQCYFLDRTLDGEIHVGRGPHNDVVVQETTVSWNHCKLVYVENHGAALAVTITAKKTTNGTFVNGIRLRAGQTRALREGDTISLGVHVVSHSENRGRRLYRENDTIESVGLPEERQRLGHPRWQFKLRLLELGEDINLKGAGRIARTAYDVTNRCRDGIYKARTVLARVRGVRLKSPRVTSRTLIDSRMRSPTPAFLGPSTELRTNISFKREWLADDFYHPHENPEGLSWYHPDYVWLGHVQRRPDTTVHELPSAFQIWSQVYGIAQGLHPRWHEFSSAAYGDDCPDDVGPESVLLAGVPPMPDWVYKQHPLVDDEEFRRKHGITQAVVNEQARHYHLQRLYAEGTHPEAVIDGALSHPSVEVDDSPASKPTTATPVTAHHPSAPSKKRRLDAEDDNTPSQPTTAARETAEPPRKRTKRGAHPTRGAVPTPTPILTASSATRSIPRDEGTVENSRPHKRTRVRGEEPTEENPAKRSVRPAIRTPNDAASRTNKRRRAPEPDIADERPVKRATRAASVAPSDVKSRSTKRPRVDHEGAQPTHTTVNEASRPLKRQRVVIPKASGAEGPNNRRSSRLKNKAPALNQ